MIRSGGCQCGACRYELTSAPLGVFVCHCIECRRQSASAFGISVEVPRAAFRMVAGTPQRWSRTTDSGRVLHCQFCPQCGTRLYHCGAPPGPIFIKGGSLDGPVDLSQATHIWTSRKLPGVVIPPGAVQYPQEPD